MKDEKIKELMNQSLLSTSIDFTDNLMNKIEHETKPITMPNWYKEVLIASLIFLLAIPLIWRLLLSQIESPSILIFTPIMLLISVLANEFLRLNKVSDNLKCRLIK